MESAETVAEHTRTQLMSMESNPLYDSKLHSHGELIEELGRENEDVQPLLQDNKNAVLFSTLEGSAMDHALLKSTKAICERYKIQFAQLTTIQRKFVTNYRCSQCGLLPLYHLNLLHVKRVRCRRCGQLIAFKRKGKYGKLRKEIAFALTGEVQGSGIHDRHQ